MPGILWLPEDAAGPRPLVLIGHGATLHKRVDHVIALARALARRHGFAAAAIDASGHGDRRLDCTVDEIQLFSDFLAEWCRPGSTDDMVADWRATLSALRELDEVGDAPVGYWGLSMGTIYGIPFVASEPRVQAAVFGLIGLVGPTRDRMETDARGLTCPVLFVQQWHDQLVPREHVFELFDAVGSLDKRLHAHPGEHSAVPAEELEFSVAFLARHLAPAGSDQGPTVRIR
ncbi:MAG: alpha/beta hydrolase [Actinobacteria bacterium]|nr:alpha/beta hydrolase [Actinomycetota bacterium]